MVEFGTLHGFGLEPAPTVPALQPGGDAPRLLQVVAAGGGLRAWWERNRPELERILETRGALLCRGFEMKDPGVFEEFAASVCGELLDYVERSTPRSRISGKVYSSTEYPPDQSIPLHNENAYADRWPGRLLFHCAVPALKGGETPLCDSRLVYRLIAPEIREAFRNKGVLYVRNFRAGVGLSWQETFQTEDRASVEDYCRRHSIGFEWLDGGKRLRTSQRRQAVLDHPATGEAVWFNQAHLFHVSSLSDAVRESMELLFRDEDLPRNALFGDGRPIPDSVMEEIRRAYDESTFAFQWREGDVLVLDNLLIAHGRACYSGPRKVMVAMGGACSPAQAG